MCTHLNLPLRRLEQKDLTSAQCPGIQDIHSTNIAWSPVWCQTVLSAERSLHMLFPPPRMPFPPTLMAPFLSLVEVSAHASSHQREVSVYALMLSVNYSSALFFQAQGRRACPSPLELVVANQMYAEALKSQCMTHHTPSSPCGPSLVHLSPQVKGCGTGLLADPWMGTLHEWDMSLHCYKPLRYRGYCFCSTT